MSSKTPNRPPTLRFYEKPYPASAQNKPSGLCIKEGIKTKVTTTAPPRIIGVPKTFPKGQVFPPTTTEVRQGTHHITTVLNTTCQTHHDGCKTRLYQWTSVIQEPPLADKEEEEALEAEGANTPNITINPLTISKTMPRTWETHQTPVFSAGK